MPVEHEAPTLKSIASSALQSEPLDAARVDKGENENTVRRNLVKNDVRSVLMTPDTWCYRLRFAAHAGIVRQQSKGVLQFGGIDFCLSRSKLLIAKIRKSRTGRPRPVSSGHIHSFKCPLAFARLFA